MAVPPVSPAKDEAAASVRTPGGKRKRPPSPRPQGKPADAAALSSPKRNKNLGEFVDGVTIPDSEHGKACHQCRQRTTVLSVSAACRNSRKGKSCPIRFCHKCLLNRYGEKAEDETVRRDWNCPKCRGICNCSYCMKKKGLNPTGMLVRTARAAGYSSVAEMLQPHHMGSKAEEISKDANSAKPPSSSKKVAVERNQVNKKFSSPRRFLELAGHAPNSNEEKRDLLYNEAKTNIKPSKSNVDKSPDELKHSAESTKKVVEKRLVKECLGRCKKKDAGRDQRRAGPICNVGERASSSDRKADFTMEPQASNGVVEEKDHLRSDNTEKINKPAKTKQTDIRTMLSDCNKNTSAGKVGHSNDTNLTLIACKDGKHGINNCTPSSEAIPEGTCLTAVAGIELQAEDVGAALQFLEFCSAFGQVLNIKKGQAESVLRELAGGRGNRRWISSLTVQFYVKLLSIIQKENGERLTSCAASDSTWLKALKKCITESRCTFEDLPVDWINAGAAGYARLKASEKLRLFNFLCDEILGTGVIRTWINHENMHFIERKKEARAMIVVAKEEGKLLKKKMKDEMAQDMLQVGNDAPTISHHLDLVSKIKSGKEKAHSEVLGSLDVLHKKNQRSDVVRTEPIFLEGDGRTYWKLKTYDSSRIVLQDIGNWDLIKAQDKWYIYDDQQERLVEKHIHSLRCKQLLKHMIFKSRSLNSPVDHTENVFPGILHSCQLEMLD